MVGIRRKKRKGLMSGQVRQEELLAEAVVIEGRKEWHCRFWFRDQRAVKR